MKDPCKQLCSKCGSSDIHRSFRAKGSEVEVAYGDQDISKDNEFVYKERWCISIKKDHIAHHCRCCQYEWESNVKGIK